jgi:hypothetical protein
MAHRKTVRSYRVVFRRRWRIFRVQGWRIPLPGGIELRLIGYWLACLAGIHLLGRLPLLGLFVDPLSPALRLLALPLAIAWLLSRWELDGRPPHRALLGLLHWRLRPRTLAGLRRVPSPGTTLAPLTEISLAPDLASSRYPAGVLRGPVRVLLRYPLSARRRNRRLDLRPRPRAAPLHRGRVLELPAGSMARITTPAR